jgi:hypothetical protein
MWTADVCLAAAIYGHLKCLSMYKLGREKGEGEGEYHKPPFDITTRNLFLGCFGGRIAKDTFNALTKAKKVMTICSNRHDVC